MSDDVCSQPVGRTPDLHQRGGGNSPNDTTSSCLHDFSNVCLSVAQFECMLHVLLVALVDPSLYYPDWFCAELCNRDLSFHWHGLQPPITARQANQAFGSYRSTGEPVPTVGAFASFVARVVLVCLVCSVFLADNPPVLAYGWDPNASDPPDVEGVGSAGRDAYYLWDAAHPVHAPTALFAPSRPGFDFDYYCNVVCANGRFDAPGSVAVREVAYLTSCVEHATQSAQRDFDVTCFMSALDGFMPHGNVDVSPCEGFEKTEHGWTIGHHPDFSAEQISELKTMLVGLKSTCFAYSLKDLTGYTGGKGCYTIPLTCSDDTPILAKPRRHSALEYAVMDEKCRDLLDAGIIVPSSQYQYACEVVIAAKKNELGEWVDKRFCQDYRPINAQMVKDNYRLPLADEIFDTLGDCSVFSVCDMRSGFYSIPILEEHQPRTAFYYRGSVYHFTRMPFGLHSAPQTYQRIMDYELKRAGCWTFTETLEDGTTRVTGGARAFIDDVILFSISPAHHVKQLKQLLEALGSVGLKVHPDKCRFGCSTVEYLGFNVSQYGLTPHQAKIAAIAALKAPKNVSELRSVLGLLCYYRRFVVNFSAIANPLNALLKKGVAFEWTSECDGAFNQLKTVLCTEGLALKRVDPSKPLLLYTDWSKQGIAGVLAQVGDDGTEHICCTISRSLNKHETNYCSFKGELLAVVWSLQTLRVHCHGASVTVITDHEPLKWLLTKKDLQGQYARWAVIVGEYDLTVLHRAGSCHTNADALSRMPREDSTDCTGSRLDGDCITVAGNLGFSVSSFIAALSIDGVYPVISPLVCLANQLSHCPLSVSSGLCTAEVQHSGSVYAQNHASTAFASNVIPSCDSALLTCTTPVAACTVGTDKCATDWQLLTQLACQAAADYDVVRYSCLASSTNTFLSSYDMDPVQLLLGNLGSLCDDSNQQPVCNSAAADHLISNLKQKAAGWHVAAHPQLCSKYVEPARYHSWKPACFIRRGKEIQHARDDHGVIQTAAICTHVIGQQFFASACTHGLVVCELFGGMCSGLEMVLRNGILVSKYLYCDKDPAVQRIAAHRLDHLNSLYPALLPPESYRHAFTSLPQDVSAISSEHLVRAGAQNGEQWLVVAGFECQDLSPAGSGQGLSGEHSVTFFPMKRVVGALQQLQPHRPPGYFIENTYLKHNFGALKNVNAAEFHFICQCIGHPIACDAAQFGSYAHRLRHYWTNLACGEHLQTMLEHVHRPAGLIVTSILQPGRTVLLADKSDVAPMYRCNVKGEPLSAFPTFTAYKQSHAFRPGRTGAVFDSNMRCWTEPNADEREAAMGFDVGCTLVPTVPGQPIITADTRHAVLGRAMDMNAISSLFAMCLVLHTTTLTSVVRPECSILKAAERTVEVLTEAACVALDIQEHNACSVPSVSGCISVDPFYSSSIYAMAATEEQACCSHTVKRDVWMDPDLLAYVQKGVLPVDMPARTLRQLQRRASKYQWVALQKEDAVHETLYRKMADGSTRVVPPPDQRLSIVKQMHETAGHFGEKRTIHLLLSQFWWYGLYSDVYQQVKGCELCRQVNTSFTAKPQELQPLPIMALGYRWGVDLAGEFIPTKLGNRYIMVCVEHLSKWVEIVCLKDKSAASTSRGFLSHVISRFGAPAEVVSDCGAEWKGEFDSLLERCYIDHRVTAPYHPACNGLSERMVQTFKMALSKYCAQEGDIDNWDEGVYWIALGYRASVSASTKFSPYELMFARQPVVPPAVVQRFAQPINFDDPALAAECLLHRAAIVKQLCPEAMANLQIAQHRDVKRYAMLRSGEYKPSLMKLFPGQFVYVKRHDVQNTLQIKARPEILRVVSVGPAGQVTLQGKCGTTIQQNIINVAPCHLPNIDPSMDVTLAKPPEDWPCEVCRSPYDDAHMLLCDNCNTGWHMQCLSPPLTRIPAGTWLCPYCVAAGIDQDATAFRQAQNDQLRQDMADRARADVAPLFSKQRRRMLAEAESLHGRYIVYPFPGPNRTKVPTWGLVQFKGSQHYPRCMRVYYATGQHFDVTLRSIRPYLQGVHATPPSGVVINVPTPDADVVTGAAVACHVLPSIPPVNVVSVHAVMPTLLSQYTMLTSQDVAVLRSVVNFASVRQLLDPFAVNASACSALSALPTQVLANQLACLHNAPSSHVAAMQPEFWVHALRSYPLLEAAVGKPWLTDDCVDCALVAFSEYLKCACVMVPSHYLASPTTARAALLASLQKSGRLHIVVGLPETATTEKCTWLCVFGSAEVKQQMLHGCYSPATAVSYVPMHS